jgi:hypothetical protein
LSSDPRDVIYAVLSRAKDGRSKLKQQEADEAHYLPSDSVDNFNLLGRNEVRNEIESVINTTIAVDYQKDVVDVLQDFTEGIILNSNSLDMLFLSWAPDGLYPIWRCPFPRTPFKTDLTADMNELMRTLWSACPGKEYTERPGELLRAATGIGHVMIGSTAYTAT